VVQRNARGDSDADSRTLSLRRRPRRVLRRRRQRDRLCADLRTRYDATVPFVIYHCDAHLFAFDHFFCVCLTVIALDTSPTRLALARHNAALHGLATRIEFILADFRTFAARMLHTTPRTSSARKIDVVFLSPPWGGPEYLAAPVYSLAQTQPEPAAELFRLARLLTPNVAFYVPRNTALEDIAALLPASLPGVGDDESVTSGVEQVEVEEEWMGPKLKALTCYFGGLAQGQDRLF